MPTLLEKIAADAAARLPLPPNRQLSQELVRYKRFLKLETHRLKILHRAGGGGLEICQARAAVLDTLMRYLFEAVTQQYLAGSPTPSSPPPVTIVAVGGYGRAELNPSSDIDIMFLHDGSLVVREKEHPFWQSLSAINLTLYDIGLKVGYSVRNLEDCVRVANNDMQSKTSLIEARAVAGNLALIKEMQRVVLTQCIEGHEAEYIASRMEDQEVRRAKYGNSATMQEPNIKNGCGGLRDYQNLLWMAFFKYRVRSLAELEKQGQLSENERRQLETAYDYLLRVRNELHYLTGRACEVMTKSVQPSMATNMGFTDRSPMKRIEAFMHVVYTHTRNIYLITRTLEQRLALSPSPRFLPTLRALLSRRTPVVDGFKLADGMIRAASPQVFKDHPRRLMRVFLLAQKRGVQLHPDLAHLIRHQLPLAQKSFLQDPHVRDTFLEILSQRGNVTPTLRAMHETGLLGRYLPEFGKLTNLVQHEFFHRYTADEHTLTCIEKLDQVWNAKERPFNRYTELFQKLERPYILYLALLLHDSGKGDPATHHHSDVSTRLALRVAKRLSLDAHATQTLRLLVENHLTMTQISQRRDLDDPAEARRLAEEIKTPENLDLLLLHTFADSMGTSAELWNDFKESLLWMLYRRTLNALMSGPEPLQAETKRREALLQELRRRLPHHYSADFLAAHLANLPARYYQIHTTSQILVHLNLVQRFLQLQEHADPRALEPVVSWQNEADRGYAAATVCTWDRPGLFSKISGAFSASGMNILGAQIFSRDDRIILDTFSVVRADNLTLPKREEHDQFFEILKGALTDQVDLDALIARRIAANKPAPQYLEGERLPTTIIFDQESSDDRTVIELQTEDRLGLLYTISRTLAELQLNITTAKICTEKGAAIDTFYVSELAGGKILPDHLPLVEQGLRAAVAPRNNLS